MSCFARCFFFRGKISANLCGSASPATLDLSRRAETQLRAAKTQGKKRRSHRTKSRSKINPATDRRQRAIKCFYYVEKVSLASSCLPASPVGRAGTERVCAQCLLVVSSICMREPRVGGVDSAVVLSRQTGFSSALHICERTTTLDCVEREESGRFLWRRIRMKPKVNSIVPHLRSHDLAFEKGDLALITEPLINWTTPGEQVEETCRGYAHLAGFLQISAVNSWCLGISREKDVVMQLVFVSSKFGQTRIITSRDFSRRL